MTTAKHSPKKVTLAMIKGKPITTSVPVIHYHAGDDELEDGNRLTLELESISSKVISTPSKYAHESDISENNSETQSVSTENILLEGTPPSLDPWKVFSDIKGKITKTFEEKLSEIKSDKKKRRNSRGESSSISDLDDQGCTTPFDEKMEDNKQVNEPAATAVHQRGNPTRYVGFSGIKTGLKDKSLQSECVESGIEASEFSQDISEDIDYCLKYDSQNINSSNNNSYTTFTPKQIYTHSGAFSKQMNFKSMFLHSIKQLIFQSSCKVVAVLVAIFCIFYVIPVPEYLLGFTMGVFMTVTFYNIVIKIKNILSTLPEENYISSPAIAVLEIPAVEEHAVLEKFQGWLNELPYSYEPNNYHVARTKSVFFRLEGNILCIMETRMKVPKRAVWDEPKHKLKFVKRRVYDLTEAKIELFPHGLARRRRWSKKYPICITLQKEALISNVILKCSTNNERSINRSRKIGTEKKVKYESDGKCAEGWVKEADMENEQPTGIREDKQDNGDEQDTADDDDYESYNYVWTNDGLDNEFEKFEECFLESEETGELSYKDLQNENIDQVSGRSLSKVHDSASKKRKIRKNLISEAKTGKKSAARKWSKDKQESSEKEEKENNEDMKDDTENEEEEELEEYEDEEEEEDEEEGEEEEEENDDEHVVEVECIVRNRQEEYEEEEEQVIDDRQEDTCSNKIEKCRNKVKNLKNPAISCFNKRRNKRKIFVFARADREKEDWYRRLISAAKRGGKKRDSQNLIIDASCSASSTHSTAQKSTNTEAKSTVSLSSSQETIPELSYNVYMTKLLDAVCSTTIENTFPTSVEHNCSNLWINCIISRLLFDIRKCPETINLIQDKIQRKLSSIKLPYFMECLLVSEITIGQGAPVIRNVTKPVSNERGLWFDLDIMYKGSLTMTVETKLNLMKLTKTGSAAGHSARTTSSEKNELSTRSPIFDSDLEDTPETSTEDDCDISRPQSHNVTKDTASTQSSGKKFLSMVDRIAANKYFQHATELSYVRRAMEGVSNTEIRFMVTISGVEGWLSVNIPPSPSDRLWYGFKPVPKVSLTVQPAVGERAVNIVYITKWIETKLLREFEKLVVLPNMDDLIMPLCPNYPYPTMR